MDIDFLGTGGAWGLPEVSCDCLICQEMRKMGEKRERTALLLSGQTRLLIDCGPDIRSQLLRHEVEKIDGVLITHEHGDHYMGMDELFAYKRNSPRHAFDPIPVYLTAETWKTIAPRFAYLEEMGVIETRKVKPGVWFEQGEFKVMPFKTEHGSFARGSVGFVVRFRDCNGKETSLAYTSDFMDLPEVPEELLSPDYLIIQSFWLNEPVSNRPHHMSFQRALHFMERLKPGRETFLVHMGDADMVAGDPANKDTKKYEPRSPLGPPSGGPPYPIPLNQEQWQHTVERILVDRGLSHKVTVAHDGLRVSI